MPHTHSQHGNHHRDPTPGTTQLTSTPTHNTPHTPKLIKVADGFCKGNLKVLGKDVSWERCAQLAWYTRDCGDFFDCGFIEDGCGGFLYCGPKERLYFPGAQNNYGGALPGAPGGRRRGDGHGGGARLQLCRCARR